ncbi:transcription antitermination factor NusB [Fructilactobacillus vespulae]|uniref:transcription antitermination factor NusB n=1 Tax=Fructilactobacillus vespulae TaxID=1249630 RepID=UPI0039B4E2CC
MKVNRHQIRELAFQTLFALESNDEINVDECFHYITKNDANEIPDYYHELVFGVREHQSEINEAIQPLLDSKWVVSRLNKADLIILQLAFYEMKFVDDVPAKVSINEALELAKKFSDDKSVNFINAILDKNMKKNPD